MGSLVMEKAAIGAFKLTPHLVDKVEGDQYQIDSEVLSYSCCDSLSLNPEQL